MIYMITLDGDNGEIVALQEAVSEAAAHQTEDYWDTKVFRTAEEHAAWLKEEPLIDFCCCDVSMKGVLKMLPEFRKKYEDMGLMLIADADMSPLEYLKPGIRADALLIRPITEQVLHRTMKEFVASGLERRQQEDKESAFVMETKEGRTYIPYDSIYYFEAREKKIFARLLHEEHGFYSTIDELGETLPAQFARCHRSYIVNTAKIRKVMSSQNLVELLQGFTVPLSRSYKQQIRDIGK